MTKFKTTVLILIKLELLLLIYLGFLSHQTGHFDDFYALEKERIGNLNIDFYSRKTNDLLLSNLSRAELSDQTKIEIIETLRQPKPSSKADLQLLPKPLLNILYQKEINNTLYIEYQKEMEMFRLRANCKTIVESINYVNDSIQLKISPFHYLQPSESVELIIDGLSISKIPSKIKLDQEYNITIKNPVTGKVERYIGL